MPADASRLGGTRNPAGTSSAETAQFLAGKPRDPATAGGTNFDTLVGRKVVEMDFATSDEVDAIRKKLVDDPNQRSLTQALIDEQVITGRQLQRLRQMVEQEKSGQAIPGYKIKEKLGAGAMATVYKATQLSLDRSVAIKILPRKFSTNAQFIERFYAEGRAAAQLNHPNIVQAFDVGQAGEFHYFVMEFVDGQTVHDLIVANKRFNEQEATDIAISVAEALDHAHNKGLIHRDVKPKNIMFTPQGVVKLADLGLARAVNDKEAAEAEAGKAYGTPYYISPEQIRGEVNVGIQADIYSLGATLYHMITGNVPFNGKNPNEVMQKHLKAPLVPPDHVNPKLSPGLSEIVEKMMAKSRKDRYKNCQEMLADLKAVKRGEVPPIAHKEAPAAALEEMLKSSAAVQTQIRQDSSQTPSPFAHPKVKALIGVTIAALAFAAVMAVVAIMGMMN
jgi:serine/threonine protein kinase